MKGIKLFVETNFRSQAITAYPITKATPVATKVSGIEKTLGAASDEKASFSSYSPLPNTAGSASRNE
jgi:hypothetical protein